MIPADMQELLLERQVKLVERGVRDVKLHFTGGDANKRAADAVAVLGAVIDGKFKPIAGIGDAL